jgi:hypothetical protein
MSADGELVACPHKANPEHVIGNGVLLFSLLNEYKDYS